MKLIASSVVTLSEGHIFNAPYIVHSTALELDHTILPINLLFQNTLHIFEKLQTHVLTQKSAYTAFYSNSCNEISCLGSKRSTIGVVE